MLAIAMMATIRRRANATTPPKTMRRTANHDDGHVAVLLHQPGGAV
jgi:hypothetical protein